VRIENGKYGLVRHSNFRVIMLLLVNRTGTINNYIETKFNFFDVFHVDIQDILGVRFIVCNST
jgi:hypothetical protein